MERTQREFDWEALEGASEAREAAPLAWSAGTPTQRTDELIGEILGAKSNAVFAALELAVPLEKFPDLTLQELSAIAPDFGPKEHRALLAAVELGRRVSEARRNRTKRIRVSSSSDAKAFCSERFSRLAQDGLKEEVHIVTLDTKNGVIDTHLISVGTLDASLVHPREVFRPAIRDSASSILVVHNHPSGDPTPSKEDRAVTRKLEEAGKNLGIDVLDHIVIGTEGAVSVREAS